MEKGSLEPHGGTFNIFGIASPFMNLFKFCKLYCNSDVEILKNGFTSLLLKTQYFADFSVWPKYQIAGFKIRSFRYRVEKPVQRHRNGDEPIRRLENGCYRKLPFPLLGQTIKS